MAAGTGEAGKLGVFISYSRDDLDFADQLDATLRIGGGFETVLDRHGIHAGEEWKARLGSLIRDADTVVFVLTPNSARSEICEWEVEEARRLGKRIMPVVPGPLGDVEAPRGLADPQLHLLLQRAEEAGVELRRRPARARRGAED